MGKLFHLNFEDHLLKVDRDVGSRSGTEMQTTIVTMTVQSTPRCSLSSLFLNLTLNLSLLDVPRGVCSLV